jgi:polysaccharide pyruvyl transferase WcaK-like protein
MRVLIAGPYGNVNHGDDSILYSIASEVVALGHEVLYTTIDPNFSLGIDNTTRIAMSRVGPGYLTNPKVLSSVDAMIVGGGEQLLEGKWGNPIWGMVPNLYHLVRRADKLGLPIMFWGVGMSPVRTRIGTLMIKRILKSAKAISLRDQGSLRRLRNLSPKFAALGTVTADPVFRTARVDRDISRRYVEGLSPHTASQQRTILFAPAYDTSINLEHLETVVRGVEKAAQDIDAHVLVKLMNLRAEGDEALRHHPSILSSSRFTVLPQEDFSFLSLCKLYRGVDVTVGTRMHALIHSACQGTPWVNIARGPKMEALGDMFQLPYLPTSGLSESRVRAAVSAAAEYGREQWEEMYDPVVAELAASSLGAVDLFNLSILPSVSRSAR